MNRVIWWNRFRKCLVSVACLLWGNWTGCSVIGVSVFCNQETLEQEVQDLEKQVSAIQQVLGDLKVQLYAKFGNNINLEADESWAVKWTLTVAPVWTFPQTSCIGFTTSPKNDFLRLVASFIHANNVSAVLCCQTCSQGHQTEMFCANE